MPPTHPEQRQRKLNKALAFEIETLSPPKERLQEISGREIAQQFVGSVSASPFGEESLLDFGSHAFLRSMHQAYADHRPFVFSPDMIWLLVLQSFSKHINYNADLFAQKWGLITDKEALSIRNDQLRPDSPPAAWEEVLLGFDSLLQGRLGPDLITELAPDFSTTNPQSRIAASVTMLDSFKAFFDYIVFTCTCGIPSISLEGEQADWIHLKTKVLALRKYDLAWWIDGLVEPLEQFIAAFDGEIDTSFWRDMFKFRRGRSCGEFDSINGWITRFYPYDREGRRRAGLPISDIKNLPDEIVKVDFVHQYLTPMGPSSVPLQFVSGFMAASQNADTLAIRPHISWVIAHPKPAEQLLLDQAKYGGLSFAHLSQFPSEILDFERLSSLSLSFMDEVHIPNSIANIKIDILSIRGKISPRRVRKIARLLPYAYLEINGKQYIRKTLKRFLSQYRWINRICWPEENLRLDFEAEMISTFHQE